MRMSQGSAATAGLWTPPPLVSALPANPVDGQECYFLASAVDGVVWHLRYRAAAPTPYRWEKVGGPPLHATYQVDINATPLNQWSGYQPSITAPLAGTYRIQAGSMWRFGAAGDVYQGWTINGVSEGQWYVGKVQAWGAGVQFRMFGEGQGIVTTAGHVVTNAFYLTASASIINPTLSICPVRVG